MLSRKPRCRMDHGTLRAQGLWPGGPARVGPCGRRGQSSSVAIRLGRLWKEENGPMGQDPIKTPWVRFGRPFEDIYCTPNLFLFMKPCSRHAAGTKPASQIAHLLMHRTDYNGRYEWPSVGRGEYGHGRKPCRGVEIAIHIDLPCAKRAKYAGWMQGKIFFTRGQRNHFFGCDMQCVIAKAVDLLVE